MRRTITDPLIAITESEQSESIVHVDASDTMHATLSSECGGSVDTGEGITEYWAESWRVHVHTIVSRSE